MQLESKLMLGERVVRHRISGRADARDAFLMSNYVAAGGAHHVTMATQGMDVYERMAFDRTLAQPEYANPFARGAVNVGTDSQGRSVYKPVTW